MKNSNRKARKKSGETNKKAAQLKNKEHHSKELNIDKITIPNKKEQHLDNLERAVLWHMYLGAQSIDKISNGRPISHSETRQILEGLENKLMAERRNLMGQYKLTESGLKKIEP